MKKIIIILLVIFMAVQKKGISKNTGDGIFAEFTTDKGVILAELFYETAPLTVANFVGLAEGKLEFIDISSGKKTKRKYYDNLIFHRVIDNFMIQGGCPLGRGTGGPGYNIDDEFDPSLNHNQEGVLSMANAGPNTGGSQFFITTVPTPWLNNKHAVFGRVIQGMDVVKKIGKSETEYSDRPKKDIKMKIKIIRKGDKAQKFDSEKIFKSFFDNKNKAVQDFNNKLAADRKDAVKTESGLMYVVIKKGSGKKPAVGQIISAHYSGYLENGVKFDSSYDRNSPFMTEIGIGRVIKGWDEAFLDMQVGEKRRLIIPSHLGYGSRGVGPIPPDSTLIFDVELMGIK
jgi:cyclophilin family peptidyl-prolyl cis-trans isomerase